MSKPFFIFVEGTDGAGKSTACKHITSELKKVLGDDVKISHDLIMQSTEVGAALREILISEQLTEDLRFHAYCFGVFYGLMKLQEKHKTTDFLIVDRSQATTYAQNIFASDKTIKDKELMINIFYKHHKTFTEQVDNNFLFVNLTIDPEVALERLFKDRGFLDIVEKRGAGHQRNIAAGYETFFRTFFADNKSVLKIDTETVSPQEVAKQTLDKLRLLGKI